jgi:hypothetical protein
MTPRGIRNNNPGNLRPGPDPWLGQAAEQTDADFLVFRAPEYGLRALAKTLLSYQHAHGLKTIAAIINRFAPPSENDTAAYVASVARACAVAPDAPIDLRDAACLSDLIRAIVRRENGVMPYSPALIATALALAGIGPDCGPSAAAAKAA